MTRISSLGVLMITALIVIGIGGCDRLGLGEPPPKSENVKKLDALADKACGCTDTTCGEAVLAEVNAFAAGIGQVPEDDRAPMQQAQSKMDLCLVKTKPYVIEYKAAVDEICACPDAACAKKVSKKFDEWSARLNKITAENKTRVSNADIREISLAGGRAVPCFNKFGLPVPK